MANASIPTFKFRQGRLPLLVSMPHVGTHIPPELAAGMTEQALQVPDTDWHLERLYDFLDQMDVSMLVATHSRYVIDLNRPLGDINLYPGQDTTWLCPIDTFCKHPVYRPGMAPGEAEKERRINIYWRPYHDTLASELRRMHEQHGVAMLWDAHSICSVVPRFFEGRLPDFNLGTASGASCDESLAERLLGMAQAMPQYSAVLNGRFKGGYITRHYGQPRENVHAVQLELSEATYMNEAYPFEFDETLAAQVRPVLRGFIEAMLEYARRSGAERAG